MKTFEDLVFGPHHVSKLLTQARLHFDNGYGISVIAGQSFGEQGAPLYDVAVLHDGQLCYETPINAGLMDIDPQTAAEVSETMQAIQMLPEML